MNLTLSSATSSSPPAPESILSINFGITHVSMALFRGKGPKRRLVAVTQGQAPARAEAQAFIEIIDAFLKKHQAPKDVGVIATWRADFLEKPVVLPEMPAAEVRSAITFGMEQHFQLQLTDCLYDWVPSVEIVPAHGSKAFQYFVYAIQKEQTKPYLDALNAVSSNLLSIVPSSMAYGKVVSSLESDQAKDLGIISIGSTSTNLLIFRQGKPLLARTINVGRQVLLDALKARPTGDDGGGGELSDDDAALLLNKISLDPSAVPASPEDAAAAARLLPELEGLQEAVEATLAYYAQQSFVGEIGKIYLCGSGAKIKGLDRYLESKVEVPVHAAVWSESVGIAVNPDVQNEFKNDFIDYTAVTGAYLNWRDRGLNLVPKETLEAQKLKSKNGLMIVGAAALTLACLFFIGSMMFGLIGKKKLLAEYKHRVSSTQAVVIVFDELQSFRIFKASVNSGNIPLYGFMKMLSAKIPDKCVLTRLEFDKLSREFRIEGQVFEPISDPVTQLANFVESMTKSPFVNTAELSEGTRDPATGAYKFKIKGTVYE